MVKTLMLAAALLCATSAHAWVFNPPTPDLPDNWPPYGQNVDRRGPDATFESRQRRKLLRHLFPGATDYPRDRCHFALQGTPEKPNVPYRARNLVLQCRTAPGVWTSMGW